MIDINQVEDTTVQARPKGRLRVGSGEPSCHYFSPQSSDHGDRHACADLRWWPSHGDLDPPEQLVMLELIDRPQQLTESPVTSSRLALREFNDRLPDLDAIHLVGGQRKDSYPLQELRRQPVAPFSSENLAHDLTELGPTAACLVQRLRTGPDRTGGSSHH